MKIFHVICLILFLSLQHSIFLGSNSIFAYFDLKNTYNSYNSKVFQLSETNSRLKLEIAQVSQSKSFLEAYARQNYGYIKENEIFFQIIKNDN